jgi:hypothetical protein
MTAVDLMRSVYWAKYRVFMEWISLKGGKIDAFDFHVSYELC